MRLSTYLQNEFPECFDEMSPAEVEAWTDEAVTKSERYGITTEPEVAQLILLFLLIGSDADERIPWFRDTLINHDLHGLGKVRNLMELARSNGIEGVDHIDMERPQ